MSAATRPLAGLDEVISRARECFINTLATHVKDDALSVSTYQRYLSMQYHLTRDVQRYFITAAAHSDLAHMRALRKFLLAFANEEEFHYLVAGNDLAKMGEQILPMPFDVELWHCYFTQVVATRPFVRLGAATVLDNLSDANTRPYFRRLLSAPFLNRENTKFLVLHMHETLPHGQQILDALQAAPLQQRHLGDLLEGARKGAVLYLRMAERALNQSSLATLADTATQLSDAELSRVERFDMAELAESP